MTRLVGAAKHVGKAVAARFGYDVRRQSFGAEEPFDLHALLGAAGPDVVFDVGGHVGESALEFARRWPRAQVFTFEPNPRSFATLSACIAPHSRIRAFETALGRTAATVDLFLHDAAAVDSLLPNAANAAAYAPLGWMTVVGTTPVRVTTLDAFCDDQGIERIDLLKIDTQGYEAEVLRGANRMLSSGGVRVVKLELLFAPVYARQADYLDVLAAMRAFGFGFVGLYGAGRRPDRSMMWCDALFVWPDPPGGAA